MIQKERGVVLVGKSWFPDWPEQVPSYSHPLVVRLAEEEDLDGAMKTFVKFDNGVTGEERYELTPDFLNRLSKDNRLVSHGGDGWPMLSVNSKELAEAIKALQTDEPCSWVGHATVLEDNHKPKSVVLSDLDARLPRDATLERGTRYFELQVGLDPDRDKFRDMLAGKASSSVDQLMLAPPGYEKQRPWGELVAEMEASRKESHAVLRELAERAEDMVRATRSSGKPMVIDGVAVGNFETFGEDKAAGVRGRVRTMEGLDFDVVAFGGPANTIADVRDGQRVKVAGMEHPRHEGQLRLVAAERVRQPRQVADMEL